jgi:hypothetical protein
MTDSDPEIPSRDFLNDWLEREQERARRAAAVLPANKEAIFAPLAAAGVTSVTVGFDGAGDSGQIEEVTAYRDEEPVPLPPATVALMRTGFSASEDRTENLALTAAIENLAYDLLEEAHAGWENNDGAYGEFTFHVSTRGVTLDFNQRFTDSEHFEHIY